MNVIKTHIFFLSFFTCTLIENCCTCDSSLLPFNVLFAINKLLLLHRRRRLDDAFFCYLILSVHTCNKMGNFQFLCNCCTVVYYQIAKHHKSRHSFRCNHHEIKTTNFQSCHSQTTRDCCT